MCCTCSDPGAGCAFSRPRLDQDAGGIRTGPQGQGQWTANGGPAALLLGGWPCAETAKQGGSAVATWEPTFAVTASGLAWWWPVCVLPRGAETWEFTSINTHSMVSWT